MKISLKILTAFAIVLVMTIVLGTASLISVSSLGDTTDEFAHTSIPSIYHLEEARRATITLEAYALEAVVADSRRQLDLIKPKIEQEHKNINELLDKFIELSPQYQEEVDSIKNCMKAVEIARDKVIAECEKESEDNKEAYSVYSHSYAPAFDMVTREISALSEKVMADVETTYAEGETLQSTTFVTIIAILIASLGVIAAITFVLTKLITKPLKEIEKAMLAISQGELFSASVNYNSKDELGMLANAAKETIFILQSIIPDIAYISRNIGEGRFNVDSSCTDVYVGEYSEIL